MKKILTILLLIILTMGCINQSTSESQPVKESNHISNVTEVYESAKSFKAQNFNYTFATNISGLQFYEEVIEEGGIKNVTQNLIVIYNKEEIRTWSKVDLIIIMSKDATGRRAAVRLYLWKIIQDKNTELQNQIIDETLNVIESRVIE